ncbi:MAG TPA: hypothetical protein VN600_06865 [Gemmatimonadaceae bacterium]|nr:hypothetical protein [Gemmatimonadaceae bacterium]
MIAESRATAFVESVDRVEPIDAAAIIARATDALRFARGRRFLDAKLDVDDLDALVSIASSVLLRESPR